MVIVGHRNPLEGGGRASAKDAKASKGRISPFFAGIPNFRFQISLGMYFLQGTPHVLAGFNLKLQGTPSIGVLLSCFARTIDGPGLPGGLIIYQGNPSISPKRTPMTPRGRPPFLQRVW